MVGVSCLLQLYSVARRNLWQPAACPRHGEIGRGERRSVHLYIHLTCRTWCRNIPDGVSRPARGRRAEWGSTARQPYATALHVPVREQRKRSQRRSGGLRGTEQDRRNLQFFRYFPPASPGLPGIFQGRDRAGQAVRGLPTAEFPEKRAKRGSRNVHTHT